MINRVFADILRVASILLQEAADSSRVHEMLANFHMDVSPLTPL
jgi:hypothetical protein